jgi:hypothetical protein
LRVEEEALKMLSKRLLGHIKSHNKSPQQCAKAESLFTKKEIVKNLSTNPH